MSVHLAEAIAKMQYGKSSNPAHPENDSQDFQDGYVIGSLRHVDGGSQSHEICDEYRRRGCPEDEESLASFRDWKRGYWAAVFRNL